MESLGGVEERWLWEHYTAPPEVGQGEEVQGKRATSNSTKRLTSVLQSGGERIQGSSAWWSCVGSLQGSVADLPWVLGRILWPCLPCPTVSVSFPRGETNFFPIFYHSCLIRFQVLKGTNCFILCISVACGRGRNYSWLEFLGSTLIPRCWNSSLEFRQNSKVCVCLLLCCALGHRLQ